MENLVLSLNAVLPMLLVMITGYAARRFGVISGEDVPRVNRAAFRIFLPCMLFYNIYCADLSQSVQPGLIAYSVVCVLLVFAASVYGAARFVPQQDHKGVVAQGIFRSNFVIMGLPIAGALAGEDNLSSVAVLIAVIVPLFNFLAVVALEKFRGRRVKTGEVLLQIVRNPLIVGSFLGILFQLLNIRLPAVAEKAVSNLGSIATPLQIFLLGAFFRFDGLGRFRRTLAAVTGIKLFLIPALVLGVGAALGFRGVDFLGLLGAFGAPTAVNSFTMVQQMQCGDAELAGDIVVITTLVSIFSFFIWILVFKTLGMF